MDLRFTAEELAFRAELRGFIRHNLPPDIAARMKEGRRRAKRTSSPGSASSTRAAGPPIAGPRNGAARAGTPCSA